MGVLMGNIRWIGNDQVKNSMDSVEPTALQKIDGQTHAMGIVFCNLKCFYTEVQGLDLRLGSVVLQGQGDLPAASPKVYHLGVTVFRQKIQGPLDQSLRVRARHQNADIDLKI